MRDLGAQDTVVFLLSGGQCPVEELLVPLSELRIITGRLRADSREINTIFASGCPP